MEMQYVGYVFAPLYTKEQLGALNFVSYVPSNCFIFKASKSVQEEMSPILFYFIFPPHFGVALVEFFSSVPLSLAF
eukprot:gene8800-6186_t